MPRRRPASVVQREAWRWALAQLPGESLPPERRSLSSSGVGSGGASGQGGRAIRTPRPCRPDCLPEQDRLAQITRPMASLTCLNHERIRAQAASGHREGGSRVSLRTPPRGLVALGQVNQLVELAQLGHRLPPFKGGGRYARRVWSGEAGTHVLAQWVPLRKGLLR